MMAQTNHHNHLLALLPAADFELIHPHLKPMDLPNEKTLFRTGDPIKHAYFPHSGIISLVVELASGESIEAAMIGRDSVVGASAALDGQIALNTAIVQIPGAGSILDVQHLKAAAEQSATFRITLVRHAEALFAQAQQSVACNVTHALEARLARWLLGSRDLAGSDGLPLTQEFLSQMLGVRRTSVSLVAHTLQHAGLIQYRRGHIQITNTEGLKEAACECYDTVKQNYDRLLNGSK
jgi:CRP-like cAMP-binding protein